MDEEEAIDEARELASDYDRLREIVELTKQARAAQKKYFQTRDRNVLIECKQLERKLDDALSNG